jgi:prepilin peptidase CpaA
MPNFRLLDILPALVLLLVFGVALWHDIRSRRIPNQLIVLGSLAGFLLHMLLPPGSGLFSIPVGSQGIVFSVSGFVLGLLLLLPFYAIRTLGAGDVKLMALVGAFIGPWGVMGAALLTMLVGGALALVVAAWKRQLLQVIVNIQQMFYSLKRGGLGSTGAPLDQPAVVTGKLAYAIAIAGGTAAQLWLAGSPSWRLFS